MPIKKSVRIIKKIRDEDGQWRFVSLRHAGARYVWDKRPGHYFVEWWEGKQRKRESAGITPSEAMEAQRRKRNEIIGAFVLGSGTRETPKPEETKSTLLTDAVTSFIGHVKVHSPDKPRTAQRYSAVLDHMKRILGRKLFVEAITRPDIDDYKAIRTAESGHQNPDRRITPRTINFELSVLRTFFYFLISERNLPITNPCAKFKPLKDSQVKAKRRPPTYHQDELNRLFAVCNASEKTIFATFLLTGFREEELCFLTWADVDVSDTRNATLRVSGNGKDGFSPKDYEERIIPIPQELAKLLEALTHRGEWVFSTKTGNRHTHLLRRLKQLAEDAKITGATLHKFRHTYATRLLESGCDIVTVQKLMGHSDLDTTRQYLDPDEKLKRSAVSRLSLAALVGG